jgi:hypothetical protein
MSSSDEKELLRKAWLVDQVTKSEFFHQKLHEYGLLEIAYRIERVRGETLDWNQEELGISHAAWNKVIHRGIKPVRVFAHPDVLVSVSRSVGYYQKMAMVSLKSLSRIGLGINRYESGDNKQPLPAEKALAVAVRLNELISRLVESDEDIDVREFDLWRGMAAGSTAQGSWGNRKGDIAEELVKGFFKRRLLGKQFGDVESGDMDEIGLEDGRTVSFGAEPDIAVYDARGKTLAAIEIKGGIDQAGVLERVGAAIKSLSRAKQENSSATTVLVVYAVSMTDQAAQDLEAHRNEIDHWFMLEDVLEHAVTRRKIYALLGI